MVTSRNIIPASGKSGIARINGAKFILFFKNSEKSTQKVPVLFLNDCIGPDVERAVQEMAEGQVALLENLRFHRGETDNDPEFARQLSNLAEVFVNDAAVCPTGNTMPDKTVARARKTTTAGRKHQTSIYAGYEPKPSPLCKEGDQRVDTSHRQVTVRCAATIAACHVGSRGDLDMGAGDIPSGGGPRAIEP